MMAMLEAQARFSGGIPDVFVRVGQAGDGDDPAPLSTPAIPRAARSRFANAAGRSIVCLAFIFDGQRGCCPCRCRLMMARSRFYANMSISEIRLSASWSPGSRRPSPVGPYPVLVLNGEQSAGKSTLARILRLLIDPQTCPSLALPKSTRNLMATALNGWLLVYENISTIPDWLSDCICQLAFGGGFASRTLYSNDERSVIYAQRPVIRCELKTSWRVATCVTARSFCSCRRFRP